MDTGLGFSAAADVFSIGLVIHEVATGHSILKPCSSPAEAILNMEAVLGPFERDLSLRIGDKIPGVFSLDPETLLRRPQSPDIEAMDADEAEDLTTQMIRLNPNRRPSLQHIIRTSDHWPCKTLTRVHSAYR